MIVILSRVQIEVNSSDNVACQVMSHLQQILTDFQNSFTDTLYQKFAANDPTSCYLVRYLMKCKCQKI